MRVPCKKYSIIFGSACPFLSDSTVKVHESHVYKENGKTRRASV